MLLSISRKYRKDSSLELNIRSFSNCTVIVVVDDFDFAANCGNETTPYYECSAGRWIVPASMSIFLIIGNILLLSLLIAVFK